MGKCKSDHLSGDIFVVVFETKAESRFSASRGERGRDESYWERRVEDGLFLSIFSFSHTFTCCHSSELNNPILPI